MNRFDTSTPVVVLKCLPYAWHSGTIGVIRSLGRLGAPVYLCGEGRHSPAARSRHLRQVLHETPTTDPQELLDRLRRLRLARRAVLIPMDDVGTLFLDEHGDDLADRFLFPRPPAGLPRRLADKLQLARLAEGSPVQCPQTVPVHTLPDARDLAEQWGFPVVVKAADPALLATSPGANSVRLVRNAAELDDAVRPLLDPPNLLLQEYLPGDSSAVWMVNAYLDHRSVSLFAGVGRKLRQLPVETGASTLAVVEPNDDVLVPTLDLLRDIGYRGIVDLGLRHDPRHGGYRLLDVNPRIGATFRLLTAEDGTDVARALYLDLTGQRVPVARIRPGRRWLAEHRDVVAGVHLARQDRLSIRQYLGSLRGVDERAWLTPDDPRPGLALAGAALGTAAGRLARVPRRTEPTRSGGDEEPDRVLRYFRTHATEWDDLYVSRDVAAAIYQERTRRCLALVDALALPEGSRLLEVGCGAGRTAAALAARGFQVDAVDPAQEMLALARRHTAGAERPPTYLQGDVRSLPFPADTYDVVVALGVLPWLADAPAALAEMARVLSPGGFLVLSADNRYRLCHLLDPGRTPALAGLRRGVRRGLERARGRTALTSPRVTMHSPAEVAALLAGAGLHPVHDATFGFGPFTAMGVRVLPEPLATRVHARLQSAADAGRPLLPALGAQYLAIAKKAERVAAERHDLHLVVDLSTVPAGRPAPGTPVPTPTSEGVRR
ncbi:MAG: methyltransferase domain-containing protein [Micromonospora sp.]